jgi:hypothetical protein
VSQTRISLAQNVNKAERCDKTKTENKNQRLDEVQGESNLIGEHSN